MKYRLFIALLALCLLGGNKETIEPPSVEDVSDVQDIAGQTVLSRNPVSYFDNFNRSDNTNMNAGLGETRWIEGQTGCSITTNAVQNDGGGTCGLARTAHVQTENHFIQVKAGTSPVGSWVLFLRTYGGSSGTSSRFRVYDTGNTEFSSEQASCAAAAFTGTSITDNHWIGAVSKGGQNKANAVFKMWDLGTSDPGTPNPSGWGTPLVCVHFNNSGLCTGATNIADCDAAIPELAPGAMVGMGDITAGTVFDDLYVGDCDAVGGC